MRVIIPIVLLLLLSLIWSFGNISGDSIPDSNDRLTNINNSWEYLEDNSAFPEELKQDRVWSTINIPHSWNSFDATDMIPGYRRGVSWYRKILDQKIDPEKRYILYFEGANISTEVFINNQLAGKHIGGYVGFEIDITEFLATSQNEVLIRVSNEQNHEIIPSSKSDFFIFGGITRDLWLKTVDKAAAIERVQISTPEVSESLAKAIINLSMIGDRLEGKEAVVTLFNAQKEMIATRSIRIAGTEETIEFNVEKPSLWDVESPTLYSVKAELKTEGKVVDEVTETFGFRWFHFEEHGGFFLNGKPMKLRGTHRHEEYAGYGAAMPNELHRKDIEMIKEMGANMIRLAHYPQDPEVYRACDELGLIVWDELPWCRGGIGNDVWKNNTRNLLKEMINQNYNHPSVVFWSLGNEIYWLPDFPDGDNREKINEFVVELNDMAHQLDPYRLTSIRKYYEGSHIPDVFSPSIWSGWYSGKYTDYEASIKAAMEKYPRFLHAEYGASSHLGRHNETIKSLDDQIASTLGNEAIIQVDQINYAQDGDWSENYSVDLFDWHLKVAETTPGFSGNLQWAFKDFGTPLRPENAIPYINQKGLVDRSGKPKDVYYVFKSYWSDDPFTYIESATWTERYGKAGEAKEISVYSNCEKVELILNGKSQGTKIKDIHKFPASGLSWKVPFKAGKNTLISVGHKDDVKVYDTLQLTYYTTPPSPPSKLILSYAPLENGQILLTATAVDDTGRRSTQYQEKVYFQCLQGGKLMQNYGTPNGSGVIAMANGQATVVFIPSESEDKAVLSVLNQDFKGTFLEVELDKKIASKTN